MLKICSFTGHRNLPNNKIKNIYLRIEQEVNKAISDGYSHFISGGARGTDIIAARIVTEKIDFDENISLTLMLPHKGFINNYDFAYFQPYCKEIIYIEEEYNIGNFLKRDKEMVNKSNRIICIYDNREKGGTYQTIKYAAKKCIETIIINIDDIPEDDI